MSRKNVRAGNDGSVAWGEAGDGSVASLAVALRLTIPLRPAYTFLAEETDEGMVFLPQPPIDTSVSAPPGPSRATGPFFCAAGLLETTA